MGIINDFRGETVNKPSAGKARAPEQTFEEVKYLRHLIDDEVKVKTNYEILDELVVGCNK